MDTASGKINWHYETLPANAKKALDFFSAEKWIKESDWYLAGGTALALQAGNRKSFDLDFFTTSKDFDEKNCLPALLAIMIGKRMLKKKTPFTDNYSKLK